MERSIYQAPDAALNVSTPKDMTVSERLAQTRRDMEESSAIENLKLVWGLRFFGDIMTLGFHAYAVFGLHLLQSFPYTIALIVSVFFALLEMVCIIAFFRRRAWCVIPLHIFSAISLLNFPIGTGLSIVHFMNMHKIQFNHNFS